MVALKKVIWSEGTLLTQQHFQAWERYLEDIRLLHLRLGNPHFWGIIDWEIDQTALQIGQFHVKRCQVIFPDGRIVMWDEDARGETRLSLDPAAGSSAEIYLCIPANSQICNLQGYPCNQPTEAAWKAHYEEIGDRYDPARRREVGFAIPQVQLCFRSQLSDRTLSIKIAIIRPGRSYELSGDFIPPLVRVSAHLGLRDALIDIQRLWLAKRSGLMQERFFHEVPATVRWGSRETLAVTLMHLLNQKIVSFELLIQRDAHPWEFYRECVELLGGLSVVLPQHRILDFPAYQHDDLRRVFHQLKTMTETLIRQAMPVQVQRMALVSQAENVYGIDSLDRQALIDRAWYLEVMLPDSDDKRVERFLHQAKVASSPSIHGIVESALPGVPLKSVSPTVKGLPVREGCAYFWILKEGPYWKEILEHRSLALFLSREFFGTPPELLVIEE